MVGLGEAVHDELVVAIAIGTPAAEVLGYRKLRWAPKGVQVRNPAFDVTPAELITGIICERGVVLNPDTEKIRALVGDM